MEARSQRASIPGLVMALGGTGIVAAAALPWAQHAAPAGGSITVSGLDLTWGRFTLALGVVALVAGVLTALVANAAIRWGMTVIAIAAGLTAAGIAVYHASGTTSDVRTAFRQAVEHQRGAAPSGLAPNGSPVRPGQGGSPAGGLAPSPGEGPGQRLGLPRGGGRFPSPGPGIWVAIAGGLLALVGGVAAFGAPASGPTPAAGVTPGGSSTPGGEPTEVLQPVGATARPTERIEPAVDPAGAPTELLDRPIPPRPEADQEGSAA